ncbi:MAG: Ig-like domain-containing protein [Abditibacteriota bacterium]|nr:Ig-like domain-containing protein [Abditibacteriota bacterium]
MNKKGFNYVELLIILAIIVVVSAVVYPVIGANSRFVEDESVRETCIDNVAKITKALLMYIEDWDNTTPRCYGPGSGATIATFGAKLNDGRPNGIGCLYDYVAGEGAFDSFINTGKNPEVLKCPNDEVWSNTNWCCSYFCGPSPYWFWEGGTDNWGKEGESISEYENLSTSAAIIESRQFFYWRSCEKKGHNYTTPCGFLDGHVEVFPVLTPKQLYRDQNQDYDWEITAGWGPCDAQGNISWGETSEYWNPQIYYYFYWSHDNDIQWVLLNEENITIDQGKAYTDLSVSILPETASDIDIEFTWSSSDESVATVDQNGVINAIGEGKAIITVKAKYTDYYGNYNRELTDECEVTVIPPEPTSITIDKTRIMIVGQTSSITANILPENANQSVVWSTKDKNIAIISNGKITAVGVGSVYIIAYTYDKKLYAKCKVTVLPEPESIVLDKTKETVCIGKTIDLNATVLPKNTLQDVVWISKDKSIATVSNGKVKGVKEGIVKINAYTYDKKLYASCKVTVVPYPASITLDKKTETVCIGKTVDLKATILPANAPQDVVWISKDKSIATVSNGKVKGVKEGTVKINAYTYDKKLYASSKVTVVSYPESITLDKTSSSVVVGKKITLKATVLPINALQTVVWVSKDKSIATVSNGQVKGVSPGTTYVNAYIYDKKLYAKCKVTVYPAPTEVVLNKTSMTVYVGKTGTLTASVLPEGAVQSVTFESSDTSIATVNSNGLVKGLKVGSTTVIVRTKDKSKYKKCKITVKNKPVTGVSLNKTSLTLAVGKSTTLTATIKPSDATIKTVTWTSSNTKVAKVSSTGKVTAVAKGTATISVITTDSSKKATCKVTVK